MKIFLSWSGDRSKAVAQALNEILPSMLQPISCWMSEGGIEKGREWFDELSRALSEILFGIFCLTPENQSEPWVLWEAGFLSSKVDDSGRRLAPLCIALPKGNLAGPFAIYQATDTSREDIYRLVETMNGCLPEGTRVIPAALQRSFNALWPDLEARIRAALELPLTVAAPPAPSTETHLEQILEIVRRTDRQVAALRRPNKASTEALVKALRSPRMTALSELAQQGASAQIDPPPGATLLEIMGYQPDVHIDPPRVK